MQQFTGERKHERFHLHTDEVATWIMLGGSLKSELYQPERLLRLISAISDSCLNTWELRLILSVVFVILAPGRKQLRSLLKDIMNDVMYE